MDRDKLDLSFLVSFYHAYAYALSYSLYNLMGAGQAILMHDYARALDKILGHRFPDLLSSMKDFADFLRKKGIIKDILVEEADGNKVRLIVRGCALARLVHPTLDVVGAMDYLCPIAAMAMVALARDRGYTVGESIFDYVKFSGGLSRLDEEGSITEFLVFPGRKTSIVEK